MWLKFMKACRYLPKCPTLDDKHGETAKVPVTKGRRVKEAFDQRIQKETCRRTVELEVLRKLAQGGKKSEERRLERDTLADFDSGLNKFELLRVESVSLISENLISK